MYTAIILYESSRNLLRTSLAEIVPFDPRGYHFHASYPLPHHVTLNLGRARDRTLLGMEAGVEVRGFCWDHEIGVCAAMVRCELPCDNAQPHITMCLREGVQPRSSNDLDWTLLHRVEPFWVYGVAQECR